MKNKNIFALATLSVIAIGLTAVIPSVSKNESIIIRAYASTLKSEDVDTYYSSINDSMDANELLSALQKLNKEKRTSLVGYKKMPSHFTETDPGSSAGKVTSFYSGKSATYSGNMNREHVWPASKTVLGRGSDPLEDDIHMVRPTLISENSSRGNNFFAEIGAWDPNEFGDETYRGDAARIVFYCVTADSALSLVDKTSDANSNHTMGKLSDLLKWNLFYSVKEREKVRNDAAENLQGNRNAFIDHPEYACRIWGNYNESTKAICGSVEPIIEEVEKIELNKHEMSIPVDDSFVLRYTVTPNTLQNTTKIEWFSKDEKVATVNENGLVVGVANGETEIVITTEDFQFTDSCKVIVGTGKKDDDVPPPSINSNSGCGGNILSTSVILSSISIIGVGLILLKKLLKR